MSYGELNLFFWIMFPVIRNFTKKQRSENKTVVNKNYLKKTKETSAQWIFIALMIKCERKLFIEILRQYYIWFNSSLIPPCIPFTQKFSLYLDFARTHRHIFQSAPASPICFHLFISHLFVWFFVTFQLCLIGKLILWHIHFVSDRKRSGKRYFRCVVRIAYRRNAYLLP